MMDIRKMYWWNGPKMRAKRISGKRKEAKMEMETIKRINAKILELAKANEGAVVMHEDGKCAGWQMDILEQELQDEGIE